MVSIVYHVWICKKGTREMIPRRSRARMATQRRSHAKSIEPFNRLTVFKVRVHFLKFKRLKSQKWWNS